MAAQITRRSHQRFAGLLLGSAIVHALVLLVAPPPETEGSNRAVSRLAALDLRLETQPTAKAPTAVPAASVERVEDTIGPSFPGRERANPVREPVMSETAPPAPLQLTSERPEGEDPNVESPNAEAPNSEAPNSEAPNSEAPMSTKPPFAARLLDSVREQHLNLALDDYLDPSCGQRTLTGDLRPCSAESEDARQVSIAASFDDAFATLNPSVRSIADDLSRVEALLERSAELALLGDGDPAQEAMLREERRHIRDEVLRIDAQHAAVNLLRLIPMTRKVVRGLAALRDN